MTQSDVFALKNSGLEAFLFADVGTESNGLPLTVLSAFGRLGLDPWAEAARLVDLPKAATIASLSDTIARMPLGPVAAGAARATAARLILLLPVQNAISRQAGSASISLAAMPRWLPMMLLGCALAVGLSVSMFMAPRVATAVSAPTTQSVPQGL